MTGYLDQGDVSNVDTVADLATEQIEDGAQIATAGYYSAHDGGANLYRYDLNSTATVDGGFVIDGPSSSGRYIAVRQDTANVKQFGGGNGQVASVTKSAAQAALDTGKPTYFPVGEYLFDGSVNVNTDGQHVYGEGYESSLVLEVTESNVINVRASDVTIEGLSGSNQEPTVPVGDPATNNFIFAYGTSEAKIFNLTVRNCYAKYFKMSGVQMRHLHNGLITGNVFNRMVNLDPSAADIMTWGGCQGIVISDNLLGSDTQQNIFVGAIAGESKFVITNNICRTLDENLDPITPVAKRHSITFSYDGITDVVISNNVLEGAKWSAIYGNTTGPVISNVVIESNIIKDGCTDPPGSTLAGCINLGGNVEDCLIANNQISGVTLYAAINIVPSLGVTTNTGNAVRGNHIVSESKGIFIQNRVTEIDITDNVITSAGVSIDLRIAAGLSLGGTVSRNRLLRTTMGHGVNIDNGNGSTGHLIVSDNTIDITDSTGGASDTCCGIWMRYVGYDISNNYIKGFTTGFYLFEALTGRMDVTTMRHRDNRLADLDIGWVFRGNSESTLNWVEGTIYDNVTNQFSGGGFFSRTINANMIGDVLVQSRNAAPTNEIYQSGDRAVNTDPTGGVVGWICTADGTPGTWLPIITESSPPTL